MEIKAYIEGILRKWWVVVLVLALAFWIGRIISNDQKVQYTASTSILLNGPLLATSAVPSNVVQLAIPAFYESRVATPPVLTIIIKHYPRLSRQELKNNIVVSTDAAHRLMSIKVTDTSPRGAADIANFLAQQFVIAQTAELSRQLDYYRNWLQQSIPSLTAEINRLNSELQRLTPPIAQHGTTTVTDPTTQRTITTDQSRLDSDERNLYSYQQAFNDLQNTRALFQNAYSIWKPASASDVTATAVTSTTLIQLIALSLGLLAALTLTIAMDYFSPFVRHKGEIRRIVGLPVFVESPKLFGFEQKRLLQLRPPLFFRGQMKSLRLLSASIAIQAVRNKACTLLVTSPRRKRSFAAVLTTFLAHSGHRTLLIDADFENPQVHDQIKLSGPCSIVSNQGLDLSFIMKTAHPHLFVLPSTATLAQNERLTSSKLLELLPVLQNTFDIIIIDSAPLNRADTHLLATKATQALLLVKKRRDSLMSLNIAHTVCQELRLNTRCLLLT